MEFYWELRYGEYKQDPQMVLIPPNKVDTVKRRWDNGDPIHLSTGSIPANQIKSFNQSSKPFGQERLLEDAARAFKEPIWIETPGPNGITYRAMKGQWVKKTVTQREYEKHYGAIPSYHKLSNENGLVTVAFCLAVQDVDLTRVEPCNSEEVRLLTR